MNKFILFMEKYLATLFVTILGITWRFSLKTPKPQGKVIYAFWHRNMVPLMYLHKGENIVIMVSSSKDGQLIAGPAKLFGFKSARGSSGRKGISATRELIKFSLNNSLAITPDGPKGPAKQIKDGILYLAYITKLPIVLVAVDASRETVFDTWDNFSLPKLFSKISINYGNPIFINSKEEIITKKEIIQNKLEELTKSNKITTNKTKYLS